MGVPAPSLAIAWSRDGVVLPAAGATHVPGAADIGARLACRVTAGNAGTAAGGAPTVAVSEGVEVVSSPPPVALAGPEFRGAARQGGSVTCDPGRWADPQPTLAIAWRRDARVLPEATLPTYTPETEDVGHELHRRVTATGGGTEPGQTVLAEPRGARGAARRSGPLRRRLSRRAPARPRPPGRRRRRGSPAARRSRAGR